MKTMAEQIEDFVTLNPGVSVLEVYGAVDVIQNATRAAAALLQLSKQGRVDRKKNEDGRWIYFPRGSLRMTNCSAEKPRVASEGQVQEKEKPNVDAGFKQLEKRLDPVSDLGLKLDVLTRLSNLVAGDIGEVLMGIRGDLMRIGQ